MPSSSLVRKANKASSSQLHQVLASMSTAATHSVRVLLSKELRETEKNAIWTVFEDNMRVLYSKSSFGWNPPSKREELFNPLSRFILTDIDGQLAAFSMFRFENEEGEDIIYCYDLQVHRDHQRAGLGRLLMHTLEIIGAAWHMEKVVLTVFKENKSASKFYHASGFSTDESSPNYLKDGDNTDNLEDVDYDILSKRLTLP